ncbi:MAG: ATP-binding protein [Reichenbachiella sp.]
MREKVIIFIASLLAIIVDCKAQNPDFRFHHITTEDGLSQNMVDCLIQDREGYLWFGTWNGLCKYDGYEFQVFNDQSEGDLRIGNNFIHTLYQDRYDNIWVGTRGGLFLYLNEKKKFIQISSPSKGLKVNDAYYDLTELDHNTILIGSEQGLTMLTIVNELGEYVVKKNTPFNDKDLTFQGTRVQAITCTSDNNIWIGTDQFLYRVNADLELLGKYTFDPDDFNSLSSGVILKILEMSNGEVWVGTEVGLNQYNPEADNFKRFYNNPDFPQSIIHNAIMDLIEIEGGKLVVATLGGLSVKENVEVLFKNYIHEPDNQNGLNNDFINCLMLDNDDNLWTGSERGGLNIVKSNSSYFDGLEHETGNINSLSSNTINSIFEDDKYLWVGTAGGGLNRVERQSAKVQHFRPEGNTITSLSSEFVTSIFKDSRGILWVGTWGFGINILSNLDTNSNIEFERIDAANSGLTSDFISSIVEDEHGRVWVGTLHGLSCYDLKTGLFVNSFPDQQHPVNQGVGCLLIDEHQFLWVGTREGLFRLDSDEPSNHVLSFYHDPDLPNTISNNYIISLIEDHRGNIWAGTYGQGLNKIRPVDDGFEIESFNSIQNGLSNDIIYGIVEDNNNKLWLSTDYGLNRFDPDTKLSRNFFVSEGLRNNQYYWGAYFKNDEGKLFFGGMNGVNTFFPEWISDDVIDPTAVVTNIKLIDNSVVPSMTYNGVVVLNEALSEQPEIQLSYKEKIVTFEFSSFNYMDTDVISYAYKLEGFDKEWNQLPVGRRSTSYTNLSPGNYEFMLRASGHDGKFNNKISSLLIEVQPPFWKTIWFRILAVVFMTSLILGYLRYRLIALKNQKRELEKLVLLRTEEINEQKEAISLQAEQLRKSNNELASKQTLIEGQNRQLEINNNEIGSKRDELIQLNDKLNLVSQLRLSFFTNISHEFRTPLTLIVGPMERLMSQVNLDFDVKNKLNVINRNAKRLLHLINEIMDFRKIEKGEVGLHISKVEPITFSKSILEVFKPLAEIKNISLGFGEIKGDESLWVDENKLENILYNLLSNAIKYTPSDGNVRMEVSWVAYKNSMLVNIENAVQLEEDNVVLSIKVIDSGAGISEENLPLIFKRFYRIEKENAFNVGGSGIGLAIIEELIRTHNGHIEVRSELGQGSIFEVQLPSLPNHPSIRSKTNEGKIHTDIQEQLEVFKNELLMKEVEENEIQQIAIDETKATVLVVEDNYDLRGFVSERLRERYNILEAKNGKEGEILALEYNPDLIVSDIMMPIMNGLDLCKSIKSNFKTSHIPVILLTAKSSVENQVLGLENGADGYLAKPFNFEILEARIQNLLDSRKQLKERFLQQEELVVSEITHNKKDEVFLEQAISLVTENLSNSDFGVNNLVKSLGVSRSLLHTKLTAIIDQSATEFINNLKIKAAKQMLKGGDMNVSEVAYAIGYNDPKYFSRLFKKQTGQSPKQYQDL